MPATVVGGALVDAAAVGVGDSVVSGVSLSSLASVVGGVVATLSSSSPPPHAAKASTPAATTRMCRRYVMGEIIAFPHPRDGGLARTDHALAHRRPRSGSTVRRMRRLVG